MEKCSQILKPTDRVFGVPLETGVKAIAYVLGTLGALGFAFNLYCLITYDEMENNADADYVLIDTQRALINSQTRYIFMLISCAFAMGSSYMVVLAVTKVIGKPIKPQVKKK